MRLRFDQLGKQIGREALGRSGVTEVHDEIAEDAQHADLRHEPDPARAAERAKLGLLGHLASSLCLIELYAHAPDRDEVLACVGKLIAFRRHRERKWRRDSRGRAPAAPFVAPFLWIIAAGRPTSVLGEMGASPAAGWPSGVYLGPALLRVGVVVASELPRERSTLLVRLIAGGPKLPRVLEELAALPTDAPERAVAEDILLHFEHALGAKPSRTGEEEEFIVAMQGNWAKARELGREEGLEEGREEGLAEGLAKSVLTVLRTRRIAVTDLDRDRILAERDTARLERWLERAAVAASVVEVLTEPS
jgi:hypothetical protein